FTDTHEVKVTEKTGEPDDPEEVEVGAISVTTPPTKTEYLVGEELDLTGLVVTATYTDETTKTVEVSKLTVSGFDSGVAEENQVVTVTYEGKTATFTVTILEAAEEPGPTPE